MIKYYWETEELINYSVGRGHTQKPEVDFKIIKMAIHL